MRDEAPEPADESESLERQEQPGPRKRRVFQSDVAAGDAVSPLIPSAFHQIIPVAILDACVLYPSFLRDVLLRLAEVDIFQPRWSAAIEEEWTRNLIEDRPDIAEERIRRTADTMNGAFPEAMVQDFVTLERTVEGVDAHDRHVAAAAIKARASAIVTVNTRHFPNATLAPLKIDVVQPDDFICRLMDDDDSTVRRTLERHRMRLQKPAHDKRDYLDALRRAGLSKTAARL